MKQKKNKKWMKFRHRVITVLARWVLGPYTTIKLGIHPERFKEQGNRQYLILMNHQTAFDQFFIGMSFRGPIYYIATEDIFSLGWISKLLSWAVGPIPIKKQTTDVHAVMNCIRIAREGGTIALAPEGNRTYSGKTEYMNPAIVKLAKKLALPIAIYKITGGYGVQPRWADDIRKGKMHAGVSRVIEPQEYKVMSDDELYELIAKELYVNEACVDGEYHHKNLAQYIERAMYVCPECGLSEFESNGDTLTCKNCGLSARYLPTKELEGIGKPFPFTFVGQWYEYQNRFVSELDLAEYADKPMYSDKADLSQVIVYEHKELIKKDIGISLYGDRVEFSGLDEDLTLMFDDISAVSVLGRNKLNIYYGDKVYQLKGGKRFNALKYVNIYYHYVNIKDGKPEELFLGL